MQDSNSLWWRYYEAELDGIHRNMNALTEAKLANESIQKQEDLLNIIAVQVATASSLLKKYK